MKKPVTIIFLIVFVFSNVVLARPKSVEVWFLKEPLPYQVINRLESTKFLFSKKIAMNSDFKCVPMGDGCFHPQLGFIDKNPLDAEKEIKDEITKKKVEKELKLKTFNNEDNSVVECDRNHGFDIFCGQAKEKEKKAVRVEEQLEVWVDVSTSLKNIDYSKDDSDCYRRQFITKLKRECRQNKIHINIFNTVLKELGSLDTLCINHGTNNAKRLIDWVEGSNSEKLIIITDVSEMNFELTDYLDKISAKVKGADSVDFLAKDLSSKIPEITPFCN